MANNILFPDSLKQIVDRMKTDVISALPTAQPFRPNSLNGAMCTGLAGRFNDTYLEAKKLVLMMFPDTAEDEFLIIWGSWVGIYPRPASNSSGTINVKGDIGTILPVGTSYTSNSKTFLTQQDYTSTTLSISIISITRIGGTATANCAGPHNFGNGLTVTISGADQSAYNGNFVISTVDDETFTFTVTGSPTTPATGTILASYIGFLASVISQETGSGNDLPNGATLSIVSPIVNIEQTAITTFNTISGGFDEESTDEGGEYYQRVQFRYQNIHALGNPAQLITNAKEVAGVTRVWIRKITPAVGYVTIYFTLDAKNNIIPDANQVLIVKNHLMTIQPAELSDAQFIVTAPTPVPVVFTFASITPDTTDMRASITANLDAVFRTANNVGGDHCYTADNLATGGDQDFTEMNKAVYLSAISNTIDKSGSPLQDFVLTSPSTNISFNYGELLTFGGTNL